MEYKISLSIIVSICFLIAIEFLVLNSYPSKTSTTTKNSSSPQPSHKSSPSVSTVTLPNLNLDSIFAQNHDWINNIDKAQLFTIITTGDVIPARSVNFKMVSYNDFNYPFLKTAEFLKSADLTFINLESPLIKDCPVTQEGMVFCGNIRFIEGLKFTGVDAVNLANNHALNYGIEGINQTIDLLAANNILATGYPSNYAAIQLYNHVRVAFLGWNLLDEFNKQQILNEIKTAKTTADLLLVSFHWGTEYTDMPAQWQIDLAHQAIDAGADMIVGNHPHWIQPLEVYKNKLIIYAHGNFVFDQEWSEETKIGVIYKHYFYQNRLIDTEIKPIYITDYSQPDFMAGVEKQRILDNLKNLSIQLSNTVSSL